MIGVTKLSFGKKKFYRCRIGIHSGTVYSGNIGAPSRMKFGLIGDAVNLASRLEGACKYYGVKILISEQTFEIVHKERFLFRKLDEIVVKGRQNKTTIYQVLCKQTIFEKKNRFLALGVIGCFFFFCNIIGESHEITVEWKKKLNLGL